MKVISLNLEKDTPLGSTEQEVIAHLNEEGISYEGPVRARVDPSLSYPPSTVPGSSFIRALVSEYGIIFTTSIESFYIFGDDGFLSEISVRKTTDSL